MRKKLLVMIASMLIMLLTIGISANAAVNNGTCGTNLSWTYNETNKTLTISGTGQMNDYDYDVESRAPWSNCDIEKVIVNEGVVSIGSYAFSHINNLDSITLPSTLKSINSHALLSNKLTSIELPSGLTTLGDSVFEYCQELNKVIIPSSLVQVGRDVFKGCTGLITAGPLGGSYNIEYGWTETIPQNAFRYSKLENVVIKDGIENIGDYAFYTSYNLNKIIIPSSVKNVSSVAFWGCAFKSAGPTGSGCDIEYGWDKSIPKHGLANTAIERLVIAPGIETLGEGSMLSCTKLTDVQLPDGLKSVEDYAFSGCSSLENIVLPDGLTNIGDHAFGNCGSLSKIKIPGSVKNVGVLVFEDCFKLLSAGSIGSGSNIEFGWTEIVPGYAFSGCVNLNKVVMPSSIKEFGDRPFIGCEKIVTIGPYGGGYNYEYGWTDSIPKSAFEGCSGVKKVTITENIKTIGSRAFAECSMKTAGPIGSGCDFEFGWKKEIPDHAFEALDIEKIIIPNGIERIGAYAFNGCDFTDISIPKGVKSIGDYAFTTCINLKTVILPDGLTDLGMTPFDYCSNLEKIVIPSSVVNFDYRAGAIFECDKIETAGPIGSGCNIEFGWKYTIPKNALNNCNYLKKVILPDTVTTIGEGAISCCPNLENIVISSSVTKIEDGAFQQNSKLASITIPKNVTFIGNAMFYGCENLKSVTILNSNLNVSGSTFWGSPTNLLIKSYKNGAVQEFCNASGMRFEALDGAPTNVPGVTPESTSGPNTTPNPSVKPNESPKPNEAPKPSDAPNEQPGSSDSIEDAMSVTIPDGPDNWKGKEGSEGFVYRLYNVALTRDAEEAGLKDWNSSLTSKSKTAAEVAQGIFFSEEYQNKNYTDAQYLKFLYRTMFGREADEGGMKGWLEKLDSGMSREFVFRGFAESQEFTNLCDGYNIERGTVTLGNYRDKNEGATAFVARLYTKMLGRKFEVNGIEDWTRRYLTGEVTIEDIATNGFLHSAEFTNLGLSNPDFVRRMYQTFLNREPDEGGFNDWVTKLDRGEQSRDDLVFGFSKSQEFANIKAQYGL